MKRCVVYLLAACLLLSLLQTAAATDTVSGVFERREGCELASVRYQFEDGSYGFAAVTEREDGYSYEFPAPDQPYTVIPEYYSLTVWDGAVDISWYDAAQTVFYLDDPAELAGLAALVNGATDADTPDYRVRGDRSKLVCTRIDDFLLVGAGGGNQHDTVYRGDAAHDFSGKTVYLTADLDMGGTQTEGVWSGPNWTPIGGKYPLDRTNSEHVIEAFFNGVLDGQGHRIEHLYCDRYADKGYAYSQAVGLVGYLGELYEDETAPAQAPAVRNLSVSGSVYGRRMVGGVVGRVGAIPTGVFIENCANEATVRNTDSKGIGGICGAGWGKGAIVNCCNRGEVSTTYACPAGGICGSNGGMDIYCCYNAGRIDSNGNGRGRAIGGHNSGSYTVSDCYYLAGCDDDPASNGWYAGTALSVSVSITALDEAQLCAAANEAQLNRNGAAYCAQEGGFPLLRREAGAEAPPVTVDVLQPEGGAVCSDAQGTVPAGTVLRLSNTPTLGYAFRGYTLNGRALSGPYATVTEDAVLSGTFEPIAPGSLTVTPHPACAITVVKDGTILQDGTPVAVRDYPVADGDTLYEGDVLMARAALYPGAVPDDLSYVYSGSFRYCFRFAGEGGTELATDTGRFTVTAEITGASLGLSVEPYTTHKVWTQTTDTSWYDAAQTEFTLTTARQLAGLALLVKNGDDFAGKTVRLGCDISLANDDSSFNRATRWWDGIGTGAHAFAGTFDGCGHCITDMTAISTGSGAGLFLRADGAMIRDLTVRGEAEARGGAAGLAAQLHDTQVRNCTAAVDVRADGDLAGGIAASVTGSSSLCGCRSEGGVSGGAGVGGIAGSVSAESSLCDCLNFGAVRGSGTVGGLGGVAGSIGGALTRCANYGAVQGAGWYVGGVAGSANTLNASQLRDCYNVGAVGNTHTYAKAATGGLIGYGNHYEAVNCFSFAQVQAESGTVGGLIGLDSRRSTNRLENAAYLESGCDTAVGGAEAPAGARALSAEGFASADYLAALNADGCFLLENGVHPEFTCFCPGGQFTDMPAQGDWAHAAIDWAVTCGITAGTSATTFSPDKPCTRAQVVTFLWRAAGCPEPGKAAASLRRGVQCTPADKQGLSLHRNGEEPLHRCAVPLPCEQGRFADKQGLSLQRNGETTAFTDVSQDAYYYDAIRWAVASGITNGTGATMFSPDKPCTRGQVVTFLWRAAGCPEPGKAAASLRRGGQWPPADKQGLSLQRKGDTVAFTDVDPGAYYYDAVLWAVEQGITTGTSATTFSPERTCTRAQIVTFLYRALA